MEFITHHECFHYSYDIVHMGIILSIVLFLLPFNKKEKLDIYTRLNLISEMKLFVNIRLEILCIRNQN